MALVKKFTRRITVENETYVWYFRDNSLESNARRIVIQQAAIRGQMLVIDPFAEPAVLAFEIRPRMIREIILSSLELGWKPAEKAAPLFFGYSGGQILKLA